MKVIKNIKVKSVWVLIEDGLGDDHQKTVPKVIAFTNKRVLNIHQDYCTYITKSAKESLQFQPFVTLRGNYRKTDKFDYDTSEMKVE